MENKIIIQENYNLINKNIMQYKKIKYKIKKINLLINRNIKHILSINILLIGRYFYIKSLKGCDGNEFACMNIDLKYIVDDIYYCIISAICFLIIFLLIQIKIVSIYYLFILILIIFELIYKDHGDSIKNHGILNIEGLFVFLLFGEIIILILLSFLYNIKKKRFNLICLNIIIILYIFILISGNFKNHFYCKNWDKGMNNTYINNDKSIYPCSINIPKKNCLISIIGPFLDFSKIINIKCNKRKEKEKFFLKKFSNLRNNTNFIKRIGFPITIGNSDEIKGKPAKYSKYLFDFVRNNLIDIDSNYQLNKSQKTKKPEIIVDYTNNPYGELKINLNYKKKLSSKRKKLELNKNSSNILFIFLDNLSRVHFYRQYKKTTKFLKQFLNYNGYSINGQKYHGFEFLKYHKFKGATLRNAIPMFSGVYYDEKNTMVSIVRDLKNNGYITCNVQDVCHKELMDIGELKNYTYVEFDHEYVAPSCDPNIYHYGFALFNGENGILRKCLYGKENFEQSLIYAKQFWTSYKNNKRFLRIVNTYGHEYIGEKSKYSDLPLYNFLNKLYKLNLLKNTTVFIASDHGFALMGLYKIINPDDYKIEFHLPIFVLLVPDLQNLTYEQQYSEIRKNQQNFITAFDIYYTLRYIIYGENYKMPPLNGNKNDGENLFKYINPKERTCSKYKQILHCQCKIND